MVISVKKKKEFKNSVINKIVKVSSHARSLAIENRFIIDYVISSYFFGHLIGISDIDIYLLISIFHRSILLFS